LDDIWKDGPQQQQSCMGIKPSHKYIKTIQAGACIEHITVIHLFRFHTQFTEHLFGEIVQLPSCRYGFPKQVIDAVEGSQITYTFPPFALMIFSLGQSRF
jgi:hypothetical protein